MTDTFPVGRLVVNHPDSTNNGFGDWQFLVKYRIAAGNEEHGNYILTAFCQMTFPSGQYQEGALSPESQARPDCDRTDQGDRGDDSQGRRPMAGSHFD